MYNACLYIKSIYKTIKIKTKKSQRITDILKKIFEIFKHYNILNIKNIMKNL